MSSVSLVSLFVSHNEYACFAAESQSTAVSGTKIGGSKPWLPGCEPMEEKGNSCRFARYELRLVNPSTPAERTAAHIIKKRIKLVWLEKQLVWLEIAILIFGFTKFTKPQVFASIVKRPLYEECRSLSLDFVFGDDSWFKWLHETHIK